MKAENRLLLAKRLYKRAAALKLAEEATWEHLNQVVQHRWLVLAEIVDLEVERILESPAPVYGI